MRPSAARPGGGQRRWLLLSQESPQVAGERRDPAAAGQLLDLGMRADAGFR